MFNLDAVALARGQAGGGDAVVQLRVAGSKVVLGQHKAAPADGLHIPAAEVNVGEA